MATQRGQGSEGRVEREGSSVSESAGDESEATCVCGAGKAFTEGGCTEEVVLCAICRSDENVARSSQRSKQQVAEGSKGMGLLKACSKCKVEKPYTSEFFRLNKNKTSGLDSWCRSCAKEYKRNNRFPAGITDMAKARAARALENCIICGVAGAVVVDHEHETGFVRGGLCSNCNLG